MIKNIYLRYFQILFLLFPLYLTGQIQSVYVTRGNNAMMLNYFTPVNTARQQWLNPYLYDEWKDGSILFGDSIFWEGSLRYDIFRKEMEMVLKYDTVLVTDPFSLINVSLGEHHFIYALYIIERRNRRFFGADYFETLSKPGKAKLLLRRKLRVDEEQMTGGKMALSIKSDDKTRFAVERSYFIQISEKTEAKRIRLSKRSVLAVLEKYRREVSSFAVQNHLKFSNPSDVSTIVDYYNSLN
jgi:hypothetical protein